MSANTAASNSTESHLNFGTVTPPVLATFPDAEDNDTYIVTSDGTENGTILEQWKFDLDTNKWVLIPGGGTTCPVEMTRAALIALRNAGSLQKDCHYVITNPPVTGNLLVEKILLHAVDANTLSGCYIKTGHDNTAWNGTYDIDTNRVEFVHDHLRNNRVHVNSSITIFPFGNTAVVNNVVEAGGRLIYAGGAATNNHITTLSTVTLNSGTFRENTVANESVVTISTTGLVEENNVSGRGTLTVTLGNFSRNIIHSQARVASSKQDVYRCLFTSYSNSILSGTGNLEDSKFHNESTSTLSGTGVIYQITVKDSSRLTISATGSLQNTTVQGASIVTLIAGSNYQSFIKSGSTYNQVGTGYLRYATISNQSSVTNGNTNIQQSTIDDYSIVNTTGAEGDITSSQLSKATVSANNCPAFYIRESSIFSTGAIAAVNATRVYFYRSHLEAFGRLTVSAASRIDTSYTRVSANSYLQATNGSFLTVNNSNVSASSYVRNLTGNPNTVSNCIVSGQSNMRFDGNATGGRIYYSSALSGTSMYQTTGAVNCYMYYVSGSSISQIYAQNSVNLRMYYSNATAYSYLRSINNPITTLMYYCNADGRGYVQALNNVGTARMYAINAEAQSIAELRGSTGNFYYSSFSAYFYAYVTRTTGTTLGAFGQGRRSATITNLAPVAPFATGSAWSNI